MPFVGSTVAKTRSRIAVAHRLGDAEAITEARRDHAHAVLAAEIARVVEAAPPLTEDQRRDLAGLLAGGGSA